MDFMSKEIFQLVLPIFKNLAYEGGTLFPTKFVSDIPNLKFAQLLKYKSNYFQLFTVFLINYCAQKESLKVNIINLIKNSIPFPWERLCRRLSHSYASSAHSVIEKKKKKKLFSRMSVLSIFPFAYCVLVNHLKKTFQQKKTKWFSFCSMSPSSHHRELKVSMLLLDFFSSSFFFLFSFSFSSSFCFFLIGTVAWDSFFVLSIMYRI